MTAPVIIIGGPTASGKSSLAVALSVARNGAVINADSMQLYDGLALLTAQPLPADKAAAEHRLFGIMPPQERANAASWRDLALAEIADIHAQGRLPIVTGGTGFYLNTLMQGISPIPAIDPAVRERLNARYEDEGLPPLFAELVARDPQTAARIDRHNPQRVLRALEVLEGTGTSLAAWQDQPRTGTPDHLRFITIVLRPPRDLLYSWCNKRFAAMMQNGAVEEVRAFKNRVDAGDIPADAPLCKALGYPELAAALAGDISTEQAAQDATQSTRNYAKRQTTWFQNQISPDIVIENPADANGFLQRVASFV